MIVVKRIPVQDPGHFKGDHFQRLFHVLRQLVPVGSVPHGGLDVLADDGMTAVVAMGVAAFRECRPDA